MTFVSENRLVISNKLLHTDVEYKSDLSLSGQYGNVYVIAIAKMLTEVSCIGYGKYVMLDTMHTGNFIVCVPGVAFVMPMWGYAVICLGVVFWVRVALRLSFL